MPDSTLSINGQEVALKTYQGNSSGIPVIALHGWLDNAGTFDLIAPFLKNISLYAIDFPGHGLSSHRAEGVEYYIWSYIEDVIAVADALNLKTFSLLGHSMGGAVASLVSSVFPERVERLVLLDSLGPMATSPADAPAQMRKALKQKEGLKKRFIRHYSTYDAAVEARARKGVSIETANIFAERGVKQDKAGYYWANDQRLSRTNLMSMTEEHIAAFLNDISCPTYLIASSWAPLSGSRRYKALLSELEVRDHFQIHRLEGNHHQHMEGQVEEIASLINKFFSV